MITSAITVARCDQVTIRQPTSSARRGGALIVPVGDGQMCSPSDQAEGDRPGNAPCTQDQHLLVDQVALSLTLGVFFPPHPRLE